MIGQLNCKIFTTSCFARDPLPYLVIHYSFLVDGWVGGYWYSFFHATHSRRMVGQLYFYYVYIYGRVEDTELLCCQLLLLFLVIEIVCYCYS